MASDIHTITLILDRLGDSAQVFVALQDDDIEVSAAFDEFQRSGESGRPGTDDYDFFSNRRDDARVTLKFMPDEGPTPTVPWPAT